MNGAPKRIARASRRSVLPVILAFCAAGAFAAPITNTSATTAQKPATTPPPGSIGTVRTGPPVLQVPPEAADRLRKAGLDPKDPNLGAKLRSLAGRASPAYARAHVLSSTGGSSSAAGGVRRLGAGGVAYAPNAVASALPVPGTVLGVFDDRANVLSSPASISSGGRYFFLVETKQKVAVKGGPTFSAGNTSLNYGCSAKLGVILTRALATEDPSLGSALQRMWPKGTYHYYVDADFSYLPIGRTRSATATFSFENVTTAPVAVTLQSATQTATVSVTIDHAPQVTGVGSVYPWGSTKLSNANAKLAAPGTARVGGGNWQTQTADDDLVGVGVALGPGWKVTSTAIKSAMSATSPQDLTPDNKWRGASVTSPPSGSDLRTAVHWHYSGIDSLDYTLEWTLAGPTGQRPLLTMDKAGDCDQ